MKDEQDISSLIHLLDDPDEGIYSHIRIQILALGEEIIPNLENAWETNIFGVLFQNRIEQLIHDIQFEALLKHLEMWKNAGAASLLDGVILIDRFQYPDFDQEQMLKTLEQIQQDIWLELNANLTAFEQVKVMNHILYEVYGFNGNTNNYHNPKNSFLNIVLESKKGNPLSLSLIYSIIAQNLDLPIYGVNLPRHFVLAYLDRFSLYKTNNIYTADVLFYINPFSKGTVFSVKEIDHFLEQLKLEQDPKYYQPCTNVDILIRALSNLSNSYTKLGDTAKVEEIKKMMGVLEKPAD
ncbi:MAG: transglutaminase family protein [Flavobacteriales bacterium]|nr:transglutaminase family protein [Flavobacteriales bacterium]